VDNGATPHPPARGRGPLRSSQLFSRTIKFSTIALLAILLVSLGSVANQASLAAYLSLFTIILLQGIEFLFPLSPEASGADHPRRFVVLCVSIVLQVLLARSEEHTSELQSRGHLVCRLLLEKKKIKQVWKSPD